MFNAPKKVSVSLNEARSPDEHMSWRVVEEGRLLEKKKMDNKVSDSDLMIFYYGLHFYIYFIKSYMIIKMHIEKIIWCT